MAISGQEWGITHSTQCQDPLFKWYMEKTNAQLGKQQVNAIFISNPFSCHFVIAKKKWELARAVRNGSAPSRAEQAAMVSSKSSSNTKLSFPTATSPASRVWYREESPQNGTVSSPGFPFHKEGT
eukprot:EG_transcript_28647